MNTIIFYPGVGYVALDAPAEGAGGGFRFVASPSQALTFDPAGAADFLANGPTWAVDMAAKGLLLLKDKR